MKLNKHWYDYLDELALDHIMVFLFYAFNLAKVVGVLAILTPSILLPKPYTILFYLFTPPLMVFI